MTTRLLAALLPCCGLLAQTWVHLDGPSYTGRSAAFDWARGRLVMRGYEGATWEFAGNALLNRPFFGNGPSPRGRTAMAFDLMRRRIVMFGGIDAGNQVLGDTWAWDGVRWTQLGGPQPPARMDAAMTYDLWRDRMVLHGGMVSGVGNPGDTWEHDGTNWVQRTGVGSPGGNGPVMTYDFMRGCCVLVTHPGIVNFPVSTWEWDGVVWAQRSNSGPTVTSNEGLAYDWSRQTTILVGGVYSNQTIWEWNGAAWTAHPIPGMPARLNPAVYYNPVRGRLSFTGGFDFVMQGTQVMQGSARTDTWEWDGITCTLASPDHRPPARGSHTWLRGPGHLVMFGGGRQQAPVAETWTWHGNRWVQRSPAQSPSARMHATGCWDEVQQRTLLFGGFVSGNALTDLWAWNGTTWQLLDLGSGPSARSSAALASDPQSGQTLLFGGTAYAAWQTSSLRNDTWRWHNSQWVQIYPTAAPSPREGAALAWHPTNGTALLFGGRVGATAADQLQDTWRWNGTNWQPVTTIHVPPALLVPSLHWDPAAGAFTLIGTRIDSVTSAFHVETWQFLNNDWVQYHSVSSRDLSGPVAYDPGRGRFVVNNGNLLAELTPTPATMQHYGTACGPVHSTLTVRSRARLGDHAFGLECTGEPGQPMLFAFGTAQTQLLLGNGCNVWIANIAATVVASSDSYGFAEIAIPIPASTALRGQVWFAQAGILDGLAPGGFRMTQGVRVMLGD